jgi:hypothetical protein
MPDDLSPPSLSFVLCIEAGSLEQQTVRCVSSIRRFGGRFAKCPIIAVRPRRGDHLLGSIIRDLKSQDVRIVDCPTASRYPWFGFYNKAAAFELLEKELDTDTVAFLDSDTLMLQSPELLDLGSDLDFVAVPSQSSGATTGPANPNHAYWERVARLAGLDVNTFPRVLSYRERDDMHLYWNAAVFVFRRGTGFIPAYIQENRRVLTCGLKSPITGLFYTDQVALPLVVQRLGLRFKHLPLTYNHSVHLPAAKHHHTLQVHRGPEFWRELTIVHYHRSMGDADGARELAELVRQTNPAAADWIAPLGPLPQRGGIIHTFAQKLRNRLRRRRLDAFLNRCLVPDRAHSTPLSQSTGPASLPA